MKPQAATCLRQGPKKTSVQHFPHSIPLHHTNHHFLSIHHFTKRYSSLPAFRSSCALLRPHRESVTFSFLQDPSKWPQNHRRTLAHTGLKIARSSSTDGSNSKKFGKGERTVPHHSEKAPKYYPAVDEAVARKVRIQDISLDEEMGSMKHHDLVAFIPSHTSRLIRNHSPNPEDNR